MCRSVNFLIYCVAGRQFRTGLRQMMRLNSTPSLNEVSHHHQLERWKCNCLKTKSKTIPSVVKQLPNFICHQLIVNTFFNFSNNISNVLLCIFNSQSSLNNFAEIVSDNGRLWSDSGPIEMAPTSTLFAARLFRLLVWRILPHLPLKWLRHISEAFL